jgi:O-antigen/teichoic acid export membrane protein
MRGAMTASPLRNKVVDGVAWNLAQRMGAAGVTFLVTLVLARMLLPADFGLLAMIAMFIAIANSLMDSGFMQALIRKPGATETDYTTAFYANMAMGCAAYLCLFASAPHIAAFYEEPRLVLLIRATGVVIPVNATKLVQAARLTRQMDFKAQLQRVIPANVLSGVVAIFLAVAGMGVWALIVQIVLTALISSALYWYWSGWHPVGRFSWVSFREMYGFGYKMFLSGLLETTWQNAYVAVIAKVFTATIAGHYFLANKIKDLLLQQIVGSIQSVTYPALALVQDDPVRLREALRRILRMISFVLFPVLLFSAAMAGPLFSEVLDRKWLPAAPYFQLLCLAGILYPMHSVNLNVLKVAGRSDIFLYLDVFKKAVGALVLLLTYRHGVIAILLGQIASSLLAYLPNSYYSSRLVGYSVTEQLQDAMPALALAGSIALLLFAATRWISLPPWALFALAGVAVAAYVSFASSFHWPALQESRAIIVGKLRQGGRARG